MRSTATGTDPAGKDSSKCDDTLAATGAMLTAHHSPLVDAVRDAMPLPNTDRVWIVVDGAPSDGCPRRASSVERPGRQGVGDEWV